MYARAACARRARARMARVPCSRRRSANYVFGREHESGTKSLSHNSANWCNIRASSLSDLGIFAMKVSYNGRKTGF